MSLTKQAASLRIIDLNSDGQRAEITLPDGRRIAFTYRKRKHGGWRVEFDKYPDGMRILTQAPPIK